ncbi:hypothetical protein RvY_07565 [Ramazzottius varieornatus]|uniref:EB domain-containing protein n=1 Tax=Ramazzottius varieornatus TaxID=947166 RepID=A0A1D1V582_RAMVA|nr:hypothetical protein RvY_07565 [Ramazzottius varieornatus]
MEYLRASLFTLLAIVAGVSAVNEVCNRVEDCLDAGTTCQEGQCRCWLEQGAAIAQLWSCSSDNACAAFPGHVCRISRGCPRAIGSIGYCQLKSAAQKATFHDKPSMMEVQPAPMADPIMKRLNEGLVVPPVHELIVNSTSASTAAESSTGAAGADSSTAGTSSASSEHPAASAR